MQIKSLTSGNNFGVVAALFAITILVIAVAATLLVSWRAKSVKKAPFTKHPLSWVTSPGELRIG